MNNKKQQLDIMRKEPPRVINTIHPYVHTCPATTTHKVTVSPSGYHYDANTTQHTLWLAWPKSMLWCPSRHQNLVQHGTFVLHTKANTNTAMHMRWRVVRSLIDDVSLQWWVTIRYNNEVLQVTCCASPL